MSISTHIIITKKYRHVNNYSLSFSVSQKQLSKVLNCYNDGSFSGKIPQCPGVIAFGKTLYKCQEELRSSLEGWLIVKIRHGDKLPIIGRIDLNKKMPALEEISGII